jgi:phospholipase/lecithinase/hemolysin
MFQGVIPLWKEVEYYKDYQKKLKEYAGEEKANEIIREALYLVSIGTNDFLENYYIFPDRKSQFTIRQYEDFLIGIARNFIQDLYGLGARKIALAGLPPMGCLPLERTINIMDFHGCVEGFNNLALDFNGKLEGLVAKLSKELPDLKLVFADIYSSLLQIITRPSKYGKFGWTFLSLILPFSHHTINNLL